MLALKPADRRQSSLGATRSILSASVPIIWADAGGTAARAIALRAWAAAAREGALNSEGQMADILEENPLAVPDSYRVTADELRQFIERFERLEQEKKDLADQQKEVMAEAKARGYDTRVMRKVIALRKREPDDIAEEEAVLEMYKEALGM